MRYVAALFDAPVPARRALQALLERGYASADLTAMPAPPGAEWSALAPWRPQDDVTALASDLVRLGLPRAESDAYAEGVRRGAIVLLVRCPTLSAAVAAGILASAPALDLRDAVRRWAAAPATRYAWAEVPPPVIEARSVDPAD